MIFFLMKFFTGCLTFQQIEHCKVQCKDFFSEHADHPQQDPIAGSQYLPKFSKKTMCPIFVSYITSELFS